MGRVGVRPVALASSLRSQPSLVAQVSLMSQVTLMILLKVGRHAHVITCGTWTWHRWHPRKTGSSLQFGSISAGTAIWFGQLLQLLALLALLLLFPLVLPAALHILALQFHLPFDTLATGSGAGAGWRARARARLTGSHLISRRTDGTLWSRVVLLVQGGLAFLLADIHVVQRL